MTTFGSWSINPSAYTASYTVLRGRVASYLWDSGFKPQHGDRLSRLMFFVVSSVPPGKLWDSILILGHDSFLPLPIIQPSFWVTEEAPSSKLQINNQNYQTDICPCTRPISRLSSVAVSVLTTGPKGRGFETGQGDGFLRAIKIRSTTFFWWEVKLQVSYRKTLRHVNDLLKSHRDGQNKFSFSSSIFLLATRSLCWQGRQRTGDCQSALVDKLGGSRSRYHHTMVHIKIVQGWTIGP
jgi:hypothetical protein